MALSWGLSIQHKCVTRKSCSNVALAVVAALSLLVASTDQDSATLAETLPGSLVQAGLSQMVTEERNLRLVRINGMEPTLENLENGRYPYEEPSYLAYSDKTSTATERLLDFPQSGEGRSLLRDTRNLPVAE